MKIILYWYEIHAAVFAVHSCYFYYNHATKELRSAV